MTCASSPLLPETNKLRLTSALLIKQLSFITIVKRSECLTQSIKNYIGRVRLLILWTKNASLKLIITKSITMALNSSTYSTSKKIKYRDH